MTQSDGLLDCEIIFLSVIFIYYTLNLSTFFYMNNNVACENESCTDYNKSLVTDYAMCDKKRN